MLRILLQRKEILLCLGKYSLNCGHIFTAYGSVTYINYKVYQCCIPICMTTQWIVPLCRFPGMCISSQRPLQEFFTIL